MIGQRTFDDLGAPLYEVPFCVLDLETTGGSPASNVITEIGAVRYRGGEREGAFQTLVNPEERIPAFITVLTGITQAMVIEAPRIETALPTFLEFLGDAVIVGHNVRFDLSFLNAACDRLGYARLSNRVVDTLGLARRLLAGEIRRLNLASLAMHFRSPVTPTHRALADAEATAHVFFGLLDRAGTLGVVALEDLLALPTARGSPHYGKLGLTEALPRQAGVYFFVDCNGTVFYVGKARNLRTRVRSYFYGDRRRRIHDMLRELERIDFRACATELEAQVSELRLIHHHRPRHNRRSRPPKASHWVRLTTHKFARLVLARTMKPEDGCTYLGPFRSRRAAQLVQLAIWDAVPIRRCTGSPGKKVSICQYAQLGVAMCPCDGSLLESDYQPVVAGVRNAIEGDPEPLLTVLRSKVARLAREQRFEEAAWTRDRYQALARAIERRRAWQALTSAGLLRVETASGEGALIDRGRLVTSWPAGQAAPLLPSDPEDEKVWQVPSSVLAAEEAHLLWSWLADSGARIVEATAPMLYPAAPVRELRLAG